MTIAWRVAVALAIAIVVGFAMMWSWGGSRSSLFLRTIIIGLSGATAFSLFEIWPRRLPRWLERWVMQVVAVGLTMPLATVSIYLRSAEQVDRHGGERHRQSDGHDLHDPSLEPSRQASRPNLEE